MSNKIYKLETRSVLIRGFFEAVDVYYMYRLNEIKREEAVEKLLGLLRRFMDVYKREEQDYKNQKLWSKDLWVDSCSVVHVSSDMDDYRKGKDGSLDAQIMLRQGYTPKFVYKYLKKMAYIVLTDDLDVIKEHCKDKKREYKTMRDSNNVDNFIKCMKR